jgi:hypothetical protein
MRFVRDRERMTLHKRLTCPSSSSKRGSRSTWEPLLFHWLEALFFCGRAFLLHPSESSFLALARSGQRTALSFRAGMENDGQFRGGRASGWKWRRSRGCGLSSHGRTWLYTMMPVSARIDPYTVCQLEFLQHDLSGWSNFVRGKMDTPTDAYNWRYRGGPWRRRRTTLARAGTARRTGRCQPVAPSRDSAACRCGCPRRRSHSDSPPAPSATATETPSNSPCPEKRRDFGQSRDHNELLETYLHIRGVCVKQLHSVDGKGQGHPIAPGGRVVGGRLQLKG